MATPYTPTVYGTGIKARIQKLGGFLAGMVMPNIGAFIAWGLVTALFIPTGWIPNAQFDNLVTPMITYLLPLLIGYTGGRMVHGQRGAVVGAIATMGVVVGSSVPMFLGAMIVGPLAAYLLKRADRGEGPHRLRDAGGQLLARHPRRRPRPVRGVGHRPGATPVS
jgi:PTS system mannitol-specific IIC component